MPICVFCGGPITEQDYEDNDYCDTDLGEAHNSCYIEHEDDAEYRRGDEEYDRSIGT